MENHHFGTKDKVQEKTLSSNNPFESIGSLPDEDESRIEEFFRGVDQREAEQNAYDESYVEAQKLSEEHMVSQAYMDDQVSKEYVDSQFTLQADSPAIGDLTLNVDSGQMLVHDGSNWVGAEPNGMVGALVVKDASGEQLDVCATILGLETRVKELERELLGKKINELSDEIDEHKTSMNKASAFERAMGGI